MGGVHDDEPPVKRVKVSPFDSRKEAYSFCQIATFDTFGNSMAKPLPSKGKEVVIGGTQTFKRDEFVRIITSTLYSLGYEKSGALLEEESGIELHSEVVGLFKKQVIDGNWDDAVLTLHKIQLDDNTRKSASFCILQQKFFELLKNDRLMDALRTLRLELMPLGINRERVHDLASCLVSSSLGISKLGVFPNSPLSLLDELHKLLPPGLLIRQGRLADLVEQALNVQRKTCYFHNTLDDLSLYADHKCGKEEIPSQTIQVLHSHNGEVLYLQFSNKGKYLASASNDKKAMIWEVRDDGVLSAKHTLSGHEKCVMMAVWSPDDRQLLTCGTEEAIRRWDVESGNCLQVYEKAGHGMVSCGWSPDGTQVLSCVTNGSFCIWDLEGREMNSWKGHRSSRDSDFAVTSNGRLLVSTNQEKSVLLFDRETKVEKVVEEDQIITSFSLSRDSRLLLVNLVNEEIHLWSIKDDPPQLVTRYRGHKRSRFVIRSCFGGLDEAFVASGSEDSQVYIWHRATGNLIQVLPGHSGAVNCVSWNPADPQMLASASDDCTIRIWGTNNVSRKHKPPQSNGTYFSGAHSNGFAPCCNGNSK